MIILLQKSFICLNHNTNILSHYSQRLPFLISVTCNNDAESCSSLGSFSALTSPHSLIRSGCWLDTELSSCKKLAEQNTSIIYSWHKCREQNVKALKNDPCFVLFAVTSCLAQPVLLGKRLLWAHFWYDRFRKLWGCFIISLLAHQSDTEMMSVGQKSTQLRLNWYKLGCSYQKQLIRNTNS